MSDGGHARVGRAEPSQLRLVVLILEGYFYLALIVAVFAGATGFLVWGVLTRKPFIALAAIFLGVPAAAVTGRALRALWFAWPRPRGVEIGPHFGGSLHEAVRDIARTIGAPHVHRILVTGLHNASVVQMPRIGVFWPVNTLLVGYPLLATLSVDQMRAVIAHELGHLTRAHGRFSSWVHRTRLTWIRLVDALEEHRSVPAHVYLLFRFYVPRLSAQAAAVSRHQELLSDRMAADVTGPRTAAQALVAIAVCDFVFEESYWRGVFDRVPHEPHPPAPYSHMSPEIWQTVEDRTRVLARILSGATEPSDTHPSLRDRLAAIGQTPEWPGPLPSSAADDFFGTRKAEVAGVLDREWQAAQAPDWSRRHDDIRRRRDRVAALSALPSPTPEQTFERGRLIEEDGDEDAALDLYVSAHRQGHAAAGLAAGRLLLDGEDAAGLAMIDAAMEADAGLVVDGCRVIAGFLRGRGRHVDAHRYQLRLNREAARVKMAHAEHAALTLVDKLVPCLDTGIDVVALSRRMAAEPSVLRAFLATKELRHSEGTQTVLAVVTRNGGAPGLGPRLCDEGLLPADVTVVALGRQDQALEDSLRAVPGAVIYDRSVARLE